MKILSLLSLTIVVLISNVISYGQTVYSPSLDLYVNQSTGGLWNSRSASEMDSMINNNMMQQMEMGRQALVSAIMEDAARKIEGGEKIRIGRATTKIIFAPQNSIVERMLANAKTPQEKQEIRESFNLSLQTFNNILKAKRLTPNDALDGDALAFVLSYIVYKGEDPGQARLLKFSTFQRKNLLADAAYQGKPDAERQATYESRAFRAMMAVRSLKAATRAGVSAQEKQTAETTAREYAAGILKEIWSSVEPEQIVLSNTTAWGFETRGEAIIESGKATVTFTRSNTMLSAAELAKQYRTGEPEIESLLGEFDAEVKRRGGATNDAAWVNAVAFALAYEVYSQHKIKLNQPQLAWVLKEMQKDMLGMASYQGNSNEEKQKYYEAVALKTMVVYDQYRRTNDAVLTVSVKQILNDIFAPRKLDDYILTATGFVKK